MNNLIRCIVICALHLGLVSTGWAFQSDGVINRDFSYRNLQISGDQGSIHLSGLLKNRSDRAHLGVMIFFRASDCVTGRTKGEASLYIDNIDPDVELPFKVPLSNGAGVGYVCRFNFRTGYNILPLTPVPVVRKQTEPRNRPQQPRREQADESGFYSWIDAQGFIRYSKTPPDTAVLRRREDEKGAETGPIYSWVDRNGITRYSDTAPEPAMLLERHRHAMQTAKNMDTYLSAMRQWIWGHWLHPKDLSTAQMAFRAVVQFNILPDGRIRNIEIETSSGVDTLDESFYNAVAKSDPLVPLPTRLERETHVTAIEFRSAQKE